MKKLRVIALSILFMALIALFAIAGSAEPARAQGLTYTYNFIVGNQGWIANSGGCGIEAVYAGGSGWTHGSCAPSRIQMCVLFDQSTTVNSVDVNISAPTGGDHDYVDVYVQSVVGSTCNLVGGSFAGPVTAHFSGGTGASASFSSAPGRLVYIDVQGDSSSTGIALPYVTSVVIHYTGSAPVFTPTQPPETGGAFFGGCPLFGDDNSTFSNLPGSWTFNPNTLTNPSGLSQGLFFTNGQASLTLNLVRTHKYKIDLKFHVPGDSGDSITVQLGSSDPIPITVDATADPQSFATLDAGLNFQPDSTDSNIYTFTLKELLGGDEPSGTGLVIDLACVTDRTPAAQIVPIGGTDNAGICKDCTFKSTGDIIKDFFGVLAWLWCGLSQLFDCVLRPIVMGIWQGVVNVVRLLAFVRLWLGSVIGNAIVWLNANWGVIVAWARGTLINIVQALYNVAIFLFNLIPIVAMINLVLSFFTTPLGQIITNTAHQATAVVSTIGDIIAIGSHYVGLIFGVIVGLVGAIPIIFAALIAGFNASPTSIPVWAPTCSATNTFLYYPCLGSYILDNTLLDGPVYLIFILLLGLVALNTLLWAVRAVQEALSA